MRNRLALISVLFLIHLSPAIAAAKPNVVLVFMDNFAYGELGSYGGGAVRGAPTPRLDRLASEGLRLTNFNVEAQCVPSRAALMTGRYAVRSGNAKVPLDRHAPYGPTQWEYTMAIPGTKCHVLNVECAPASYPVRLRLLRPGIEDRRLLMTKLKTYKTSLGTITFCKHCGFQFRVINYAPQYQKEGYCTKDCMDMDEKGDTNEAISRLVATNSD